VRNRSKEPGLNGIRGRLEARGAACRPFLPEHPGHPRLTGNPQSPARAHLTVAFCSYSPILNPRRRTLSSGTQSVRAVEGGLGAEITQSPTAKLPTEIGMGDDQPRPRENARAASSGPNPARRSPRRAGAGPGAGHCGKGVEDAAREASRRGGRGGDGGVGVG
jgi:hypothetical protein